MDYVLDRTRTYRFSAEFLGPLASLQLGFAERYLKRNVERLSDTIDLTLGGRRVTLWNYQDLSIYFGVNEPFVVTLYLVIDGKKLPEWFDQPAGTWFADIDLAD